MSDQRRLILGGKLLSNGPASDARVAFGEERIQIYNDGPIDIGAYALRHNMPPSQAVEMIRREKLARAADPGPAGGMPLKSAFP
jgi:hypothetical protein